MFILFSMILLLDTDKLLLKTNKSNPD